MGIDESEVEVKDKYFFLILHFFIVLLKSLCLPKQRSLGSLFCLLR